MSEKQLGVGPFVCEWCGEIFKSLKGTRVEDGTTVGVGYCQKCKCNTWTKPIGAMLENNRNDKSPTVIKHGIDCEKVSHFKESGYQIVGMLHFPYDDRPFQKEKGGAVYYGRCHIVITEYDVVVDKDGYA